MAYKEQKLICHSSGGWKSKIRVPARSGSDGHPLQVADDRLLAGGRSQKGGRWGGSSVGGSGAAFARTLISFRGLHVHDLI